MGCRSFCWSGTAARQNSLPILMYIPVNLRGEKTGTTTHKLSWWGRLKRDLAGHPIDYHDKNK